MDLNQPSTYHAPAATPVGGSAAAGTVAATGVHESTSNGVRVGTRRGMPSTNGNLPAAVEAVFSTSVRVQPTVCVSGREEMVWVCAWDVVRNCCLL